MLDNVYTSRLRLATLILLLPVLAACSKSFVVTSEVPKPLIERLPVSAKLVYSDEFRNYVYTEKGDDRALEKVEFGAAQVGLFDRVFSDLVTLVKGDGAYDLKIEPQILDFQYSIPAETKLSMYEIWVKYRLKITDSQDAEIADWVVKGYGKTPTSMLASHLKAFNTASNMALRDIGAQLALGFDSQPSIEDYLAGRGTRAGSDQQAPQPAALDQEPLQQDTEPLPQGEEALSQDEEAQVLSESDDDGAAATATAKIPEGEEQ